MSHTGFCPIIRFSPPAPLDRAAQIWVTWASSPRAEVEWAAARTLGLARDQGLRFRDIGVVARNYGAYRDLIESIFPRFGIPVFSSAMSDILEKPVLALVTAALDTVAGNYAYDDVFRYLKTGLTDLPQEDRDLLENYVLEWDIPGPGIPGAMVSPGRRRTALWWTGWTPPGGLWPSLWRCCVATPIKPGAVKR